MKLAFSHASSFAASVFAFPLVIFLSILSSIAFGICHFEHSLLLANSGKLLEQSKCIISSSRPLQGSRFCISVSITFRTTFPSFLQQNISRRFFPYHAFTTWKIFCIFHRHGSLFNPPFVSCPHFPH